MGLIKAIESAIGTALGDQWLEAIEPDDMGGQTVFVRGIQVRNGRGSNTKGAGDIVSNGSVIHVYPDQFMMLVDGGKIVDYTAEPGYYKVSQSSQPSLFSGSFGGALKESFDRIRFGGVPSGAQKVFYVNLQEIKGLKFYAEVIPRNADRVEMDEINEQYLNEFLAALQTSINQMSADGIRISYVPSRSRELGRYMADTLDEEWSKLRGMEIQAVGIASISYDEESQNLINMRNKGAMMGNPMVREGYVQSTIAEGLKSAGENPAGSMAGFMGMGFGMQTGGGFMGTASAANAEQMRMMGQNGGLGAGMGSCGAGGGLGAGGSFGAETAVGNGAAVGNGTAVGNGAAGTWICPQCRTQNEGKFCSECGKPRPAGPWTCTCGTVNTGKFCSECGKPRGDR